MTGDPQVVLDASAILALLHAESGGDAVAGHLAQAALSTVNLTEVLQRSIARGITVDALTNDLEALGVIVVPFSAEDAELAATLWAATRTAGLGLGDRACLALAQRLGVPALTADRAWGALKLGIDIQVIR